MKLYEISNQRLELFEAIERGEVPDEAIADTLAGLDGDFDNKVDDIACFIKSLLADKQGIKTEIDVLAERADMKQHKADKLVDYLYQQFKLSGKTKVETARNVLSIRKNPPSVQIDDEDEVIKWAQEQADTTGDDIYLTYKDPTINKKALKEALKDGKIIPHVQLVAGEKLAIK